MKKLFTTLLFTAMGGTVFSQWSPTAFQGKNVRETGKVKNYYTLDISQIRSQLSKASEAGRGVPNGVEIKIPTMDGGVERFQVYSLPVMEKALADKYQLGSYVGVGLDDPSKYVRFSVAPNDFQSMIIKNGKYEFVEPMNADKTVYAVHAKTHETDSKLGFECSTAEGAGNKNQLKTLENSAKAFPYKDNSISKIADQKYRTLRLAVSVTGEYTAYFGGVAGALAQINATLTRVNGVFEKELALHLNLQNFPQLIYENAATDPYSDASSKSNWNLELQKTLTSIVGEANYDIGHLFGGNGGGGNAGCIGCICVSPSVDANGIATSKAKGSAYTSPGDGKPFGDNFDIDYVAHEMGHQIGANHTFSYELEGTGVNVEPGSGSTIMGYAGITGASTDVGDHSDPYFHSVSIQQILSNLEKKTCDLETAIANTPPVIAPMAEITIPKSTAFYLTASATDAENDPLTYSWEEIDNAKVTTDKNNLGTTDSGPSFRVFNPVATPTRYFPMFSSVMNGVLDNSLNTWEAVSKVGRITNFQVLVRDNSPAPAQQQTQVATQKVIVGNDGPFQIKINKVYFDKPTTAVTWDVANTNNAPYNSPNVKIDYTVDNGATWVTLAASTPNDGTENFDFSSFTKGTVIKIRISAIGNVFYAVAPVTVSNYPVASPACPTQKTPANGATMVSYQKPVTLVWTAPTTGDLPDSYDVYMDTNPNPTTLLGNTMGTSFTTSVASAYETTYYWKIVPKNLAGSATACSVFSFTTMTKTYCDAASIGTDYEKISNVTFADINQSSTAEVGYEDFTAVKGNVTAGQSYTFTAKYSSTSYSTDQLIVWIDFNQDKDFDDAGEMVLATANKKSPWTGTITIPATAPLGTTRMRVRLHDTSDGANDTPCGNSSYGQVEDYTLNITPSLAVSETQISQDIKLYPNPADNEINISNVSSKADFAIYNASGNLVSKGNLTNGKVNISSLTKGMYVITVKDRQNTFTSKFIKK